MHGTATDRVLRILETIRSGGQPRVALERAIYFTESFKVTEGQPLVLRWAKALKHVAENISVTIFDDELIVGRPNTWLGRSRCLSRTGRQHHEGGRGSVHCQ